MSPRVLESAFEWAAAGRARRGESESGDAFLVKRIPAGIVIGVVDGLGHGEEAATASRTALALVESHAGESLKSLFEGCHDALRPTRGAAMTLALIDGSSGVLTWAGVGTVEAIVLRAHAGPVTIETLVPRVGILGHRLPRMAASQLNLSRGDTLVFNTNGVRWRPSRSFLCGGPPDVLARRLLEQNATPNDDALVLVVRYHV